MNPGYLVAVYSGDEFECVGTIDEVAEHEGVTRKTVQFYLSPSGRNQTKKDYLKVRIGKRDI